MRGVKTPVFMRFLEAEKQGLQYPDHQFKSGCRLSNPLIFQGIFSYVPSMALILLVQVQSQVFTAKCSEPQVSISISNGMDGGSGVAKFLSLRTEI